MGKHIVKCRVCGEHFDTNNLIENQDWVKPIPNFYYHKKCYDDWKAQKDDVNAKGDTVDDTMWINATYDYMRRTLFIPADYVKIMSQWKSLLKKGRTSKGIYFAVRYFYEIEKGDKNKAQSGIGIVDFVYDRSAQYWVSRERNGERIVAQIEEQVKALNEREKIIIHRERTPKKKKKVIDLNLIEQME